MTIVYIIAILVQAGILFYFWKRSRDASREGKVSKERDLSTYEGARATAIGITADDLQLQIPDTRTVVYGVIMDWDMGGNILTLAAYITGAANVYLSTGAGITGGGKDPEVGELAVTFVTDAQSFIDRTIPVTSADHPSKGCLRFYMLTNKGLYAAQEKLEHIEDTTSPWLALFIRGNNVVNEIRNGGTD